MGHDIVLYPDEFPIGLQDLRPVGDQDGTREDIDIDLVDFFITGNVGVDLAAQFGMPMSFYCAGGYGLVSKTK